LQLGYLELGLFGLGQLRWFLIRIRSVLIRPVWNRSFAIRLYVIEPIWIRLFAIGIIRIRPVDYRSIVDVVSK
jgi:hypothetical protein